ASRARLVFGVVSVARAAWVLCRFFFLLSLPPASPTLFPTRRSSDLFPARRGKLRTGLKLDSGYIGLKNESPLFEGGLFSFCHHSDRKSTRLNSSHVKISYAVFCLKKKRGGPVARLRGQEVGGHHNLA